jgi:hypothetical protein
MPTPRSDTPMTRAQQARTPNEVGMSAADLPLLDTAGSESRTDSESYGVAQRLPLAQRSRMAGKVALLEVRLFDHDGHLRQELSDEMSSIRLGEINDLRRHLGWLSLDLHHDYVWPANIAA